jgi:hypothetical protein
VNFGQAYAGRVPPESEIGQEWRFRIGDALPSDDPVARFVVAVAAALNDNILAHTLFVEADERDGHIVYFFGLVSSHLYEAAETFLRAYREWPEVQTFVASLDQERRDEFARITELATLNAPWPGQRLKEIRNAFFHYVKLDRAAYDAGRLPLALGLQAAADHNSSLVIESDATLSGIRAKFADEVVVSAMTHDYGDDEFSRLAATLADYQLDLNRFGQAAVGRYINTLPADVVTHEMHAERDSKESNSQLTDG